MKIITYLILLTIFFKNSNQIDENRERINDGASASQELTVYEQCELDSYAESIVRLMIAEDIEGGNLTDFMNSRFHELEAFNNEVFTNLMLAEYGAQAISDENRNLERVSYVIGEITLQLVELILKSCTKHHSLKLTYEFNHENNVIIVRENTSFPLNNCLCGNYRERLTLNQEFSMPDLENLGRTFQFNIDRNEVSMMETLRYHIIPLSMFSKFFRLWLLDEPNATSTDYNRCVQTLIGRLKRSMQKLLLVRIKSSVNSIDAERVLLDTSDDPLSSESDESVYDWINGNIFLGPPNRGPFHPQFLSNGEESFKAFERGIEPIIGRSHFVKLKLIYGQLLYYVRQAPGWQPHERLINGFQLFLR